MKLAVLALVVLGVGCVDNQPPDLHTTTPNDGADLRGIGMLSFSVDLQEDSNGTAKLGLEGADIPAMPIAGCDSGCTIKWDPVDVSNVPSGPQVLHIHLVDDAGNVTDQTETITFDDVITVNHLEVTRTVDDVYPLEMEVYVMASDGTQMGCAGSKQGLGPVDVSDVPYSVTATMIDEASQPLAISELSGAFHFEAWEDDDPPVCPTLIDPAGNDLVGKSSDQTADQWRSVTSPIEFGDVVGLGISVGRPLAM